MDSISRSYSIFKIPNDTLLLGDVQYINTNTSYNICNIKEETINMSSIVIIDQDLTSLLISPNLWTKSDSVISNFLLEGQKLPNIILELEGTITLDNDQTLILDDDSVLQLTHNNPLISIIGKNVRIYGGEMRGTWDMLRQGQPNYTPALCGVYYDAVNTASLITVRTPDWSGLNIKGTKFTRSRYSAISLFSKTANQLQSITGGSIEDCIFDENIFHIEMLDGFRGDDSYIENMQFKNCIFDTNAQGDFNIRAVYIQAAYNHIGCGVALWNTTFEDCVFRNGGRMGIESWSSYAKHPDASARGTYNLSMINCEFRNIYYRAFSVGWGENFLFENCSFIQDDYMDDGRPLGEGGGLELSPVKNVTIRGCTGRGFGIGIVGGTGNWLIENNDLDEHPTQPGLGSLIGIAGSNQTWDLSSSFEHKLDANTNLIIRNNTIRSNVTHHDPAWITGNLLDVNGDSIFTPIYPSLTFSLYNGKKRWINNYTNGGVKNDLRWSSGVWYYVIYDDDGDLFTPGTVLFSAQTTSNADYPWGLTFTTTIGSGVVDIDFWFMYPLVKLTTTSHLSSFSYTNNNIILGPNANKLGEQIS